MPFPLPVSPEFTVDPVDVSVVTEGDNITLNCTAEGFPPPTVIWEDEMGEISTTDNDTFEITSIQQQPFVVSSSLFFVASEMNPRTSNGSVFRCVASNFLTNETRSGAGQLVIAGPPGVPGNLAVSNMTSTGVILTWSAPFSLLPLTSYQLSVNQTQSSSGMNLSFSMPLQPEMLSFNVSSLEPFSQYMAELMAESDAGGGVAAMVIFMTAEGSE
jgi:hypothetical protein